MHTIKQLLNLFLILLISIREIRAFELNLDFVKLDGINDYIHNNLAIDLDTFSSFSRELNSYLLKLNEYLSIYQLTDQDDIKQATNVCLRNRTDVCWHIEDSINIIDPDNDLSKQTFQWFTNYNLNSLDRLNSLSNLTSFANFNLTLDCLTDTFNLSTLPTKISTFTSTFNLNKFTTHNLQINKAFFISYFDHFDREELKSLLVCFNLFMPFVCSAFLFLLCIQNQHRRKIVELNQLFRKIECVSGLQQMKEDMQTLANVIDELKLDAKQNQELKSKLQLMINNEFKTKLNHHEIKTDINGNIVHNAMNNKGDQESPSTNFTEQIERINQQLKLNQLEQSKLKYMVCKTIESFDRILNKMHKQFQNT